MSGFTAFFVGFIGLNTAMGAAALLSCYLSWGFGIAAGVLSGLAIVVLSFKFKRGVLFFCGIYAMTGVVLTSMSIRDYVTARSGGIIEGISVRQAADHPAAGGYRFHDAVLRSDIRGRVLTTHADQNGFRTSSWSYVAAVVSADWTEREPIAVWAACGEIASCRDDWAKPFKAGVRLNPETTSIPDYRKAVENAAAATGVRSLPDALFVTWVENPSAAIDKNKSDALLTAKIWNVVWLANVLAVWAFSMRKKRKAERNPSAGVPPAVS
jgi:hypothetical protein